MGRVASLHRYPVKSLLGESVATLDVEQRGVVGDRLWSVRTPDGKIGSGKTTRRFAALLGLLELHAAVHAGLVTVSFPDGSSCAIEDPAMPALLSEHLGRSVSVAKETEVMHFDDGPVSVLGAGSVAALSAARGVDVDPGRFRPNIVVDGPAAFGEDQWVGQRLAVGAVVLEVTMTSQRCVMVDMKTADLPAQPGNLLATGRLNGAQLGVIADVVQPGSITTGDAVSLL